MKTIHDVIRRLIESRPFTEAEQAIAHQIINDHQAAQEATEAETPPAFPAEECEDKEGQATAS